MTLPEWFLTWSESVNGRLHGLETQTERHREQLAEESQRAESCFISKTGAAHSPARDVYSFATLDNDISLRILEMASAPSRMFNRLLRLSLVCHSWGAIVLDHLVELERRWTTTLRLPGVQANLTRQLHNLTLAT